MPVPVQLGVNRSKVRDVREREWRRTKPGYRKRTAVLGGYLQTRAVTHQSWGRRKTGIRVVGSPARGRVSGDGIREEGVVSYGRGSVIDPKLEGDGHTCVGQEKSLEEEGRLRASTSSSAGLYILIRAGAPPDDRKVIGSTS